MRWLKLFWAILFGLGLVLFLYGTVKLARVADEPAAQIKLADGMGNQGEVVGRKESGPQDQELLADLILGAATLLMVGAGVGYGGTWWWARQRRRMMEPPVNREPPILQANAVATPPLADVSANAGKEPSMLQASGVATDDNQGESDRPT